MDPFEKLDLNGDTTFALALEAQKRKHEIFHFLPEDLFLKSNEVFANICKIELYSNSVENNYKYYKKVIKPLNEYDVVMMR